MHPAQRSLLRTGTVDLDAILRTEQRIKQARRAPNTLEAYFFAWRAFTSRCEAAGLVSLPAQPRSVQ